MGFAEAHQIVLRLRKQKTLHKYRILSLVCWQKKTHKKFGLYRILIYGSSYEIYPKNLWSVV